MNNKDYYEFGRNIYKDIQNLIIEIIIGIIIIIPIFTIFSFIIRQPGKFFVC